MKAKLTTGQQEYPLLFIVFLLPTYYCQLLSWHIWRPQSLCL